MSILDNTYYQVVLDFIAHNDLNALPVGTTVIDGDDLWVSIVETELKLASEAQFEAHNKYIDIQIPLSAEEQFGVKGRNACINPVGTFDDEKDCILFSDAITEIKTVAPGEMIVFKPNTAHAPLIGSGSIRKAIFKVRVQ